MTTLPSIPQQITPVHPARAAAWLAWSVVCVAWGITYELIRVGEQWEPLIFTALRFSLAGFILLAVTSPSSRRMVASPSTLGRLVTAGILMFVTGNGLLVWGLQAVPTQAAAILVAMIPIYTVLVSSLWGGSRRHSSAVWAGLTIGIIGLLLCSHSAIVAAPLVPVVTKHFSVLLRPHCSLEAACGIQLGCISWAVGSIYATRVDRQVPAIAAAGTQMCAGGLLLLLLAAASGELWTAHLPSARVVGALFTLTLLGSVLAFACYTVAIRRLPVTIVALHAYLSPVIAIGLSALIQQQLPSLLTMVSAVVVFAGVRLAMSRSTE